MPRSSHTYVSKVVRPSDFDDFWKAVLEQAAELYAVNCLMCHGPTAGGDGIVGLLFQGYGVTPPPAFDSDRVRALSAGEAYWSVTNGFGFMPAFGNLLTPQERWTLIHLIGLSSEEREALLESNGG
ncbi:c-type cytochrome [candidate division TA06 bacterium]|nr:c-type cytochrome [candidate division TA06 bacterium]